MSAVKPDLPHNFPRTEGRLKPELIPDAIAYGFFLKEIARRSAPHGQYNNVVQADQGSEHYGCYAIHVFVYELFGEPYGTTPAPPSGATEHEYDRCVSGICQEVTIKKRHFVTPVSQLPQNAFARVWVFDYGFSQICKPFGASVKNSTCS